MIKSGNTVTVHYTGKYENGDVFDTSIQKDPISFEVGAGQVIPGFENAVIGMSKGDTKTVNITPEDGYGQVNKEMIVEVALDQVPEGVKVGAELQGQNAQGQPVPVIVKSVNEDTVTLDANHKLAGENIVFDIEVVDFK
jgi:peptidylprolyl isomerase